MPVDISPLLALPAPLAVGITSLTAHGLCFGFTFTYVGSLYAAQHLFGKRKYSAPAPAVSDPNVTVPSGHRDHPDTMRLRMKAVSIATRLCIAGVYWAVKLTGDYDYYDAITPTLRLLGLTSAAINTPLAYLLAPMLFIGPLYANYLDHTLPGQANFGGFNIGLIEKRNYIVGPISEELLFRSCIIAISILGHLSPKWLVFGTPLWFGIAHAHHAFQQYRQQGSTRDAAIRNFFGCLFQMSYTTVFGWFASYLFLHTGSVIPPLVSHIFCNWMGIYGPGTATSRHPEKSFSITLAYLTGIAAFIYGLRQL